MPGIADAMDQGPARFQRRKRRVAPLAGEAGKPTLPAQAPAQEPRRIAAPPPAAVEEPEKPLRRRPELEAAFGARIRAARLSAHMSQTALGQAVGISFQQVQKYERGKDRVSASMLQRIAYELRVHPGSLFDEDMPMLDGPAPDVRAALKAADVIRQVRDPRVLKHLLALAGELGKDGRDKGTAPDVGDGGAN